MLAAWDKDYEPDPSISGVYMPGCGRRPYQNAVRREASVPDALVDKYRIDHTTFVEIRESHLPQAKYGTIVMSREELARAHDVSLAVHGLGGFSGGVYANADFSRLVGKYVPVVGPVPSKIGENTTAFDPGTSDFPCRPVVISTNGQRGVSGDQGEVVLQGITVTPRCFNLPESHEDRFTLGMNPRFEDTMAWVLVTHAYSPPVEYARMNRCSKKRTRDADDPYESLFMWDAYARHNREHLSEPGYRMSTFGLSDTKQTGKMIVRAMLPWSIAEIGDELRRLRDSSDDATLREHLVESCMTNPIKCTATSKRDRCGLDLRRMLMVELLLKNTPLEPLLNGDPPNLRPVLPPCSPSDMYRRASAYARDHF